MFPKQSDIITEVYFWTSLPAAFCFMIGIMYRFRARFPDADVEVLKKTHTYYGTYN